MRVQHRADAALGGGVVQPVKVGEQRLPAVVVQFWA